MSIITRVGLLLLLSASLATLACPGAQRRSTRFDPHRPAHKSDGDVIADPERAGPPLVVTSESRTITFTAGGADVALNATASIPTLDGEVIDGPVVVIVPGAGDVSRRGLRAGDGVSSYESAVAVTVAWQEALATAGAISLAYDKRTCGPNDDAECQRNGQQDLDERGPVALAADVDAACAVARTLPGFDGRLVLMAHGQGTQIALSSTCATDAAAIVLLSPVPREIDAVLVDAVLARHAQKAAEAKRKSGAERAALEDEAVALRNLAATRQAGFASMRSGKFSREARVDGATIAFWLGWMELTGKTRALMTPFKEKTLLVFGNGDLQLSPGDKALVQGLPARNIVAVDADHHLLVEGVLPPAVSLSVVDALVALLQPPAS
jgi:hypothetical protein